MVTVSRGCFFYLESFLLISIISTINFQCFHFLPQSVFGNLEKPENFH